MRQLFYGLMAVLFTWASIDAQVLKEPINYVTTNSTKPTFKWSKNDLAIYGYEFYLCANASEASNSAVPNSTDLGKMKRYFRAGATASDTVATMDTVLARGATTYYWKVRPKLASGVGAWVYSTGAFSVGTPAASITDAGNALITLNHDTVSAISRITYVQGSNVQLLDAAYNDANGLGLGSTGSRDTLISWTEKSDTSVYTYRNAGKYGKTGSKVLTIAHGAAGVTVDMAITLENGKAVALASAWKPGGDLANDYMLLVKNAATKTSLTYPGTAAAFGPDSIKLSAMYDVNHNEYFGFKSNELFAVTDSEQTSMLKQTISLNNSTGSNKTYAISFAVKKSRLDYFDGWAGTRPLFVTKPAAGDTLSSGNHYVVWESFGTVPDTIKFSDDGGSTFANAVGFSKDTTAIDSVQYAIPASASFRPNCVISVGSTKGDLGLTGVFSATQRYLSVTTPAVGATVQPGSRYVAWSNYTGAAVTKINLSLDSGKTYSGSLTVNSTKTVDSVLYDFNGAKVAATKCFVQVYSAEGDTGKSGRFTIAGGGAIFSIPNTFADPAGSVSIPVNVMDVVEGDSVKAFDFKVTFDSTYLTFNGITYNSSMNNWIKMMDSTNAKDTNYVRVSAFKNSTGVGVKNGELLKLQFTVKNKQSIIGQSTTLTILNDVLSAAGKDALTLDVSASTNGLLKVYSSIAGSLNYFHGKWDDSQSYPISGDSLIYYYDSTNVANNAYFNVVNGKFLLNNREPNDTINFYPSASKYMASGLSSIDVLDAQAAFADWSDTLQVRARIAADVNEDGRINTTDAMAIMEISVDSTYLQRVGQTNWIFVDSTSLATFESASDSLTGWFAKHQHSLSYKLVSQMTKQDFFGVLRGDVDFSYGAAAISTMKKSTSQHVLFSTDEKLNARPGDTVWIPMNLMLNGSSVGGFNASLKVDPAVFKYTGQYKLGPSIPQDKNWYVTASSDANGLLRVAGTDFSIKVSPITDDGPALLFKYVVNKDTRRGTTSTINVGTQTVVDNKLKKISSDVKAGQAEITRMGSTVATSYELFQNYPNPFNPSTTIEYALPSDSRVDIQIFNVIGQQVATLFSGYQTVGYHQVDFNASHLSSGIYFYTIKAKAMNGSQDFHAVKKMMLLK